MKAIQSSLSIVYRGWTKFKNNPVGVSSVLIKQGKFNKNLGFRLKSFKKIAKENELLSHENFLMPYQSWIPKRSEW